MKWTSQDPLAQIEGETPEANLALNDYAFLGVTRSLRKLHALYTGGDYEGDLPTKRLATLEEWSSKYSWQARILDYEDFQRKERAKLRESRIQEWEEQIWNTAQALLQKANQMLNFPLVETYTADGKTVVTPTRWGMDTPARLAATADKLVKIFVGADSEQLGVELDLLGVDVPEGISHRDLQNFIDDAAAKIIEELNEYSEQVDGSELEP